MNIKFGSRLGICVAVITLSALGGAAYHILAAGGLKGTVTSTANNLRQPTANSNGLVAWYPLDGDTKDYSVYHNDATANNFAYNGMTDGWTAGKFGKGILFDGASDYLSASLTPVPSTGITISFWMRAASTNPTPLRMVVDNAGFTEFMGGGAQAQCQIHSSSGGAINYSNFQDTSWHNYICTWDSTSTTIRTYIDGVAGFTGTASGTLTQDSALVIGKNRSSAANYFPGSLDDLRIYNRALSATEIAVLNAGSVPVNCDQTCQIWLKFDETSGATAFDSSGHGNNGTARVLQQNVSSSEGWMGGNFSGALGLLPYDNDYVTLPNLGLTSGTVDIWINPTNVTGDQRIFAQTSGSSSQAGQIALNQSSGESGSLWVWDGLAWQRLAPDGAVKAGQWNQVVVANNGSTVTAYVNGTQQLSAASAFAFNGPTAGIGASFLLTTGGTFSGPVDDFRIYTRMLAPEEVAEQWRLGT